MSNFNDLIKQKVEQFDVPYNDAHWAEMEGKLDTIRTAKIRRNTLTSIAAVAVVGLSSFLYFNNTSTTNNQIVDTNSNTEIKVNTIPFTTELNENKTTAEPKQYNSTNTIAPINLNSVDENTTEGTDAIPEGDGTDPNVTPTINEEKEIDKTPPTLKTVNANFIVFNNKVCMGEEVSFEANEKDAGISYSWDFGDGATSKKQNPNHVYAESGKYDVTLTVTNKKSRLENKHTVRNAAVILPQPKADFSFSETSLKHDNNKLKYPYTQFNSKDVSNTNTYTWNFGNGETAKSQNPKVLFNKKSTLNVMLTVKNTHGCYNSTTKSVKIKNGFDLFSPSAFTPNNDGDNDNFIPKALLGWDVQFEMVITDLSNNVVYKTSDKNEPWKGSLNNNGSILPPGIYIWKVVTYDAEGKNHHHIGKIKILD